MKNFTHIPVLLYETINSLNIKKDGIYIDATFGYGGHSRLLLSKLNMSGKLYAIDRDKQSVEIGYKIKDQRFSIFHCNFSSIIKVVKKLDLIGKINGIIIDCGVSSPQIEDVKRGFSFNHDGPLDMRMNQNDPKTAYEWLLRTSAKDLYIVLKKYGEERFAKKISYAIINRNKNNKPVVSTKDLANLVSSVIPSRNRFKHPATRTFQAIRMYINNETEEIKNILEDSLKILAPLGRLSTISFHSVEDRIIKNFMHYNSLDHHVPVGLPLTVAELKKFNLRKLKLIKKIFPSTTEIKNNSKSRSAILRTAERVL